MALAEGETTTASAQISAPNWRARSTSLRAAQTWLAAGGKTDVEAGGRAGAFLDSDIARRLCRCWATCLLTSKGEPRKKLATKTLADARPDLLAYLTALQERFCAAAERRRAARAAALAEAALTLIDAMRDDYYAAPSGCAACWTMTT